jgi:glutamine cyclotransferase
MRRVISVLGGVTLAVMLALATPAFSQTPIAPTALPPEATAAPEQTAEPEATAELVSPTVTVGPAVSTTAPQPTRTFAPRPTPDPAVPVVRLQASVIEVYPHDTGSFTQGLLWNPDRQTFYESAGEYGKSNLREVSQSGEVLRQVDVPAVFFAEGLAQVGDRLIQLTWREGRALVYEAETFELIGTYTYETEGWGLCYDGSVLYMSDGTPNLYVRDPQTFEVLDVIPVTYLGQPVDYLNELECVNGKVWGNVWYTDVIIGIDPTTGAVDTVVDARGLLSPEVQMRLADGSVLNGIAYDPQEDVFYLTGKRWPSLFKVRFSPAGVQER